MLEFSWSEDGHLAIAGRFDASQADRAGNELGKIEKSTVIDLHGLDYISSAGLGVLVATYRRLNEKGESLTLRNMNEHIKNIFHFSGLDRLFRIE